MKIIYKDGHRKMNIEKNNEKKLKEILIWGLCRSGNHALGSFIMEHIQEMPLGYGL